MRSSDVLVEALDRVREGVERVLDDLDADALSRRPAPGANPVGWLVWHLLRVQDDHVSELAGRRQVWSSGWHERSGLPLDEADTGYGHDPDQVDLVRLEPQLLRGYLGAVHARSTRAVADLSEEALDRVVDDSYDPPVTAGARLVSVLEDDLQHVGQAAYVRGLIGH